MKEDLKVMVSATVYALLLFIAVFTVLGLIIIIINSIGYYIYEEPCIGKTENEITDKKIKYEQSNFVSYCKNGKEKTERVTSDRYDEIKIGDIYV